MRTMSSGLLQTYTEICKGIVQPSASAAAPASSSACWSGAAVLLLGVDVSHSDLVIDPLDCQ